MGYVAVVIQILEFKQEKAALVWHVVRFFHRELDAKGSFYLQSYNIGPPISKFRREIKEFTFIRTNKSEL